MLSQPALYLFPSGRRPKPQQWSAYMKKVIFICNLYHNATKTYPPANLITTRSYHPVRNSKVRMGRPLDSSIGKIPSNKRVKKIVFVNNKVLRMLRLIVISLCMVNVA